MGQVSLRTRGGGVNGRAWCREETAAMNRNRHARLNQFLALKKLQIEAGVGQLPPVTRLGVFFISRRRPHAATLGIVEIASTGLR